MSIKQNGGVFGRNPTFNDVTIDGDLEVTGTSHFEGNVGVGTDSPDNPLMIQSATDAMLRLTRTGVRSWREYIGSTGNLIIRDLSGGTPADRLSIDTTGNVNVLTGNLAFASGKGIDFSATAGTGTSELFSDYEEGVWTPVLSVGLTVVGTPSFTGTYTKIGNTVTAIASLNASTSVAAIGGSQMVNGLPYSVSGVTAGSMTNGNLNEGVNVAGYLDRIYALASTAAAPGLTATIVYKV